jgi:preprotein translocase subunit YajC
MIISMAHAAGEVGAAQPEMADTFWMNIGLIGAMFVLFYLLLIRPQQKRLREQRDMLDALKKGDSVVTAGGLVGTVSKIVSDTEVEIDIAKGVTVTAMRYTIQMTTAKSAVVVKEEKTAPKKATPNKVAAKKTTPKKVTAKKTVAKKPVTKKSPAKKTTKKA